MYPPRVRHCRFALPDRKQAVGLGSRFCALGCGIGRYLLVLGFQFWMTVMGEVLASSGTELITKDWPSGATM